MSGYEPSSARQAVNLARAAPFRIGALLVTPATRQIARDGKTETLEPRVMQVLVALRQAEGDVVTRDDLIATCWDGRVVGDNAIHRTISRLREVTATLGAGCFRLDTVNKVGYRLIALDGLSTIQNAPTPPRDRRGRRVAAALAALVVTAAILAGFVWIAFRAPAVTRVALVGAQGDDSAVFAGGIAGDVAHLTSNHADVLAFSAGPTGATTDFQLKITARPASRNAGADLALFKSGAQDLIWSATFSEPDGAIDGLRAQTANAIASTVTCALRENGDQGHVGSAQLRALFAACEDFADDPDDDLVAAWRRVVALEPENAAVLASLAYVEASLQTFNDGSVHTAEMRAAAKEHLAKARGMNDHLALTYAVETMLAPSFHYAERRALILRGLAYDPDSAILYGLASEALKSVGRLDHALNAARRAVSLDPSSALLRDELIADLAYSGYTQTARQELQSALRIWPNSSALKDARFRFEFRFGDAAALLREIDHGSTQPNSPWNVQTGPERAFLLARAQPTPLNADALVALSFKLDHASYMSLQSLVGVGRIDQAYALVMNKATLAEMRDDTEVLFRINMRPFVLDRRFMIVADQLGLVQYWLTTESWPDFCDDKDLPYNCKAEALRLHPART